MERASFHSHLVGVLNRGGGAVGTSRERIAHLGGVGDPALRNFNPVYVSLGSFSTFSMDTKHFRSSPVVRHPEHAGFLLSCAISGQSPLSLEQLVGANEH